jgi:hypothetical protein
MFTPMHPSLISQKILRSQLSLTCLPLFALLSFTTAFGQSWRPIKISDENWTPTTVVFADSLHGFVGGGSNAIRDQGAYYLYETTDGGETWTKNTFKGLDTLPRENGYPEEKLIWPLGESLFLLGSGGCNAVVSLDSGQTWSRRPKLSMLDIWGMQYMFSPSSGVSYDASLNIFRATQDSAKHFDQKRFDSIAANNPPSSAFDYSDSLHWLYFPYGDTGLVSVVTADGGRHWATYHTAFTSSLEGGGQYTHDTIFGQPYFQKGTGNVWITPSVTSNGLQVPSLNFALAHSTDYGKSWRADSSLTPRVYQVAPVTASSLWLTATSADTIFWQNPVDRFYFSNDTGKTWIIDSTSAKGFYLLNLYFPDSLHGWALASKSDSINANVSYAYIFKYVGTTAGIATATKASEPTLHLYPNPASTQLNATFDKGGQLDVLDMLGRICLRSQTPLNSNSLTLDISGLRSGAYLFQLSHGSSTQVERFMKIIK